MKVNIYCIGKTKEKYHKEEVNEYLKRLRAYAKIDLVELPEKSMGLNPSASDILKIKSEESKLILSKVKSSYTILLDVEGDIISSEKFSKLIDDVSIYKTSDISIIIGGAYGVSDELKEKVDYRLSISKMTFTHQMVRGIILEQLYRAFKIKEGSKYHK